MTRLALVVALFGGCGFVQRHAVALDVADAVVIGSATVCAIECRQPASNVSIGVLAVEPMLITFLVLNTIVSLWGRE